MPAVKPLIEILNEATDIEIRLAAIEALGILSGPLAIRPLRLVAKDEDWRIRAKAVSALVSRQRADLAGAELKRVPRPFPPDHPRADLLRHKWLQVRWGEPLPAAAGKPAFAGWCARRLRRVADVHHWLVSQLG